ncbi:MAG: ribonuclease III [bacterium]|nr:ribonuclease III [Candidatus Kapabacteria bacterium]
MTVGTSGTGLRQLIGKLFNRADADTTRLDVPAVFDPEKGDKAFVTHKLFTAEDLARLEVSIGYTIQNAAYFEQALIHRSYLQIAEHETIVSNERLEFLGDSILNMLIGEFLFHRYADIQEGDLTKLRSRLVNRKALTLCARALKLEDTILLNASAEQSLTQGNDSLLADAFEAIIAAIYLDCGSSLHSVKDFLARTLLTPDMFERILFIDENFKSILLEHTQSRGLGVPRYTVVKEEGPDHERIFTVEVFVGDKQTGSGQGRSKKEAEQMAAAEAVDKLNIPSEK